MEALVSAKGSDLHLKVGSPPRMRVDGVCVVLDGPVLPPRRPRPCCRALIRPTWTTSSSGPTRPTSPTRSPGVGRFRVNAFRQRGSVGLVLPAGPASGPSSFDELGLPPVSRRLAEEPRGLVLVTGPTGSGKTTTLAAMIDHINANRELSTS